MITFRAVILEVRTYIRYFLKKFQPHTPSFPYKPQKPIQRSYKRCCNTSDLGWVFAHKTNPNENFGRAEMLKNIMAYLLAIYKRSAKFTVTYYWPLIEFKSKRNNNTFL